MLQPGLAVTPAIRLVRRLGAGGMGSVWVADHLALRTQVVVKFMAAELGASTEAVERFSREASAAAQVRSPHVVQMLDHGVGPDGSPFIVMELLEGRDLAHHIADRGGRLPLAEIAEIVAQVAKALGRAHERGIVHRDIKPENIFLCDVGGNELFVKLLDFGIAKADSNALSSGATRTGATLGTPYYMSPEQIVGSKTIGPRSDLWSLGVLVYQCLLGVRPFDADTFGALALLIHTAPLPTPSAIDPSVPFAFNAWFARACARDPAARFASAKDLSDALSAVARGESWMPSATTPIGLAGAPVSGGGPFGQSGDVQRTSTNGGVGLGASTASSSKGGRVWIAIAAVVVLVAAGGGGAWLAGRGPRQARTAAPASSAPPPPATMPTASIAPPPAEVLLQPPPSASSTPAVPSATTQTSASSRPPALSPAAPARRAGPAPTTPTATHERDIF
jgi:serine/threonine-protein kinase